MGKAGHDKVNSLGLATLAHRGVPSCLVPGPELLKAEEHCL